MYQNISMHMINLHTEKWWWTLFRIPVDVAVNNAYQIYRQPHLTLLRLRLAPLNALEKYLYFETRPR